MAQSKFRRARLGIPRQPSRVCYSQTEPVTLSSSFGAFDSLPSCSTDISMSVLLNAAWSKDRVQRFSTNWNLLSKWKKMRSWSHSILKATIESSLAALQEGYGPTPTLNGIENPKPNAFSSPISRNVFSERCGAYEELSNTSSH